MTSKELYHLSVRISGASLSGFFNAPEQNFQDMESNPGRKSARKKVYDLLAPYLLDKKV